MAEGWYVLSFCIPAKQATPQAGQFLSLGLEGCAFRKPFAVSDYDKEARLCSILYEVRGAGTRAMSTMRTGDTLNVMGFHGNAFALPGELALLVGGGIGLGPLLYFEKTLAEKGVPTRLYAGFRTAALVPHELMRACKDALVCTNDGSMGLHGTVLAALSRLGPTETASATLYLCGPLGMLKAGVRYAKQRGMRAIVSLEAMMACATGACMGCVVPVHQQEDATQVRYKRVCVEGPIFKAEDVRWQNMHNME